MKVIPETRHIHIIEVKNRLITLLLSIILVLINSRDMLIASILQDMTYLYL
jgi:hypothetical protein